MSLPRVCNLKNAEDKNSKIFNFFRNSNRKGWVLTVMAKGGFEYTFTKPVMMYANILSYYEMFDIEVTMVEEDIRHRRYVAFLKKEACSDEEKEELLKVSQELDKITAEKSDENINGEDAIGMLTDIAENIFSIPTEEEN